MVKIWVKISLPWEINSKVKSTSVVKRIGIWVEPESETRRSSIRLWGSTLRKIEDAWLNWTWMTIADCSYGTRKAETDYFLKLHHLILTVEHQWRLEFPQRRSYFNKWLMLRKYNTGTSKVPWLSSKIKSWLMLSKFTTELLLVLLKDTINLVLIHCMLRKNHIQVSLILSFWWMVLANFNETSGHIQNDDDPCKTQILRYSSKWTTLRFL